MKNISLSIITINYNNAQGLLKTIESVINQSLNNFEYIIIDGSSTDESVEVIKKFEHSISYWISEKDNGIYNAMNKGIKVSRGNYLFFINSGDCFADNNVIQDIILLLKNEDIIYGDYIVKSRNKTWQKIYPQKLSFSHFIHDSLPHSAGAFIKRSAFKNELAAYDETLKIAADWKWYLLAVFKYNYSYKRLNKIIGVFDYSGISSTNAEVIQQEKMHVLKHEFPEIHTEIVELLQYKTMYHTLASSRFLKFYFGFKNLLKFKL